MSEEEPKTTNGDPTAGDPPGGGSGKTPAPAEEGDPPGGGSGEEGDPPGGGSGEVTP